MIRGQRITVVMPCHNEEEGVRAVIEKMPAEVDEILVVDNASTDRTSEVARELGARVVYEGRKGYGRAYRTGFEQASGDVIVTMDGDCTYPPESIPLLLHVLIEEDVDFMTARRWRSKSGEDKSPIRLLGNFILSAGTMLLFWKLIIDSQSGMWVFKRSIFDKIRPASDGMALSEEIKILAFSHPDIRCIEMPIYYGERVGVSKLNLWKDGFQNLFFLLRLRWSLGRRLKSSALEPFPRPTVEEAAEPRASSHGA